MKVKYTEIIDRFIYDYFCAHGKDPEKWQIEQETGISALIISRNYPEMRTQNSLLEKQVLELSHLTIQEIADKLGMKYQNVVNVQCRLRLKGHRKPKRKIEYERKESEERTYIHVTDAMVTKKGVKIDLKGCGGYIDKIVNDKSVCVVYANCKPYSVSLKENQYEVVG